MGDNQLVAKIESLHFTHLKLSRTFILDCHPVLKLRVSQRAGHGGIPGMTMENAPKEFILFNTILCINLSARNLINH
jgi:hypothetical protein